MSQFAKDFPCLLVLVSCPVSFPQDTRGAAEREVGLWSVSPWETSRCHVYSYFIRPAQLQLNVQGEMAESQRHMRDGD